MLINRCKCALNSDNYLGGSPHGGYEVSHRSVTSREISVAQNARNPPAVHADGLRLARRTWDLNPRGFHLPVFKTGALGRYASPPWERLLETGKFSKIERIE